MSVDSKSHDLAKSFLSEISGATDADISELAQAIQDVCEDHCREVEERESDAAMNAARADYDAASPAERNPEQYRADLVGAGRGHLLPETWEN